MGPGINARQPHCEDNMKVVLEASWPSAQHYKDRNDFSHLQKLSQMVITSQLAIENEIYKL